MKLWNKNIKKNKADIPEHFFREIDIEFLIHELKGPLSVIETGMRTMLTKQEKFGQLSSKQKTIVERTLKNSIKARNMIYTLLEIGRAEENSLQCECFSLYDTLCMCILESLEASGYNVFENHLITNNRQTIAEVIRKNRIEIDIPDHLMDISIYQDELKFRQITGNLIENAIHYKKDIINIKVRVNENFLVIDIADDGPGIAPEDHKTIFQRYGQIKTEKPIKRTGHGLGLAGAYILAKKLEGDIEIIKQQKNGALFRITIPIAPEKIA